MKDDLYHPFLAYIEMIIEYTKIEYEESQRDAIPTEEVVGLLENINSLIDKWKIKNEPSIEQLLHISAIKMNEKSNSTGRKKGTRAPVRKQIHVIACIIKKDAVTVGDQIKYQINLDYSDYIDYMCQNRLDDNDEETYVDQGKFTRVINKWNKQLKELIPILTSKNYQEKRTEGVIDFRHSPPELD
jgi:hypothetical protein